MTSPEQAITLEYKGKIALITLNQEKKLNALNQDLYYRLATLLHEIAKRDDIFITVLTGKGRFFSAGADVTITRQSPSGPEADTTRQWLRTFVSNNLYVTHAFYSHPKILITALNGPAVGLSAALIAFSDFIYAAPHAYLLTPFTSLGLVAEGGASRAFVQRLGIAKANEALIMSKRITCDELLHTGFVNRVFTDGSANPSPASSTGKDFNSELFLSAVLKEVEERLGDHLNSESLLKVKALIRTPEKDVLDRQGVLEVFGGLERFVKGVPQREFEAIASGRKKHKL